MTSISSDPIILTCAADDNYAMQLAVMLYSTIENLGPHRRLKIYVIDGGIQAKNKQRILDSLNLKSDAITWLSPSMDILTNMKLSGHISIAAYFRLLIPELLPQHYQKAIYLDTDLIVKCDIRQLWDQDMRDYCLLAVQDFGIPYVSSADGLLNHVELGIPYKSKYYNSGVLLINLEKWRDQSISVRVIEYLRENLEFVRWHDQDGLNAVLSDQWGELDPRWNQTPAIYNYQSWQDSPFSKEVFQSIIYNPFIVHFATASKPWNSRQAHPFNDLFFYYVDQTFWSGWRFNFWRRLSGRISREFKKLVH